MRTLLPRVALQLWIVLFLVFFGAEVVHLESGLRIVTHVLFGFPLFVWAARRLRGPWDRVDIAALGLLVVFLVVAVVGRDRTQGLNALGLATAYATLFLLLRREAHGPWRVPMVQAVVIGMVITLAFNAWLLIDEKVRLIRTFGAAPWEGFTVFPWESVNALPVLVLLAIPFLAWSPAGVARRVLGGALLVSAAIVVPLSVGRAGWLALAAMVVAYGLMAPATWRGLRAWPAARRVTVAAIVGVATIGALVVAIPRVVDILESSARLLLWEQALSMVSDRPLLGFGPGAYAWSRLEYGADGANLVAVRLVHNLPLQTMIDGGVVLLIGVAAGAGVWGMGVWRRRSHLTASDRWAIAALIGLASSMWLDDFSYLPATTVLVIATAAFLLPSPAPLRQPPLGGRLGLCAGLGVAALVALPHVVGVDLARASAQSARDAAVQGHWRAAATRFEEATAWHPENGGYWLGLGMARSHVGDTDGSVAAYERARDVVPGDPRAYAALAHLTSDSGEQLDLLSEAADRTLGDPMYAARLALAQQASGDVDAARRSWARAIGLDPRVWALRRELAPELDAESIAEEALKMLAASRRVDDATVWDIGLARDRLPADADPGWRSIALARAGDHARAEQLARAAISDAPYSARGYWSLGAVASFRCDAANVAWALAVERATLDAYAPLPAEPSVRREFVFREAGLGPTQPAGTLERDDPGRWPWYLISMPDSCEQ